MPHPKALATLIAAAATTVSAAHAGMTLELRATGGSGGVGVVNPMLVDVSEAQPGDIVTFDVVALISGQNANPNDEALVNVFSSFLSGGPVHGNLTAAMGANYQNSGYSNGFQVDLDGDGDLDVGSNNNATATNFFNARTYGPQGYPGAVQTIATLTMTLTHIPSGAFSTPVNCRPRVATTAGSWFEDGSATGTVQQGASAIGIGAPVILTDVPEPSALALFGLAAGSILLARGRRAQPRIDTNGHESNKTIHS
jgi:hypothetical protein